ncbi:mitochondrial translation release factor in rescue [Coccinella septempunctata]|uniref:mitochondrial translation release factor in rescue n=1 Tax=Coccinella septempunctata TaxID=41139 RepID=UPI001D080D5C|nr:mitochondrial translation release factor in rescue [Coccinella septempunctata]
MALINKLFFLKPNTVSIFFKRLKVRIDYSRVPDLKDEELEEKFVRGSGPGGQKINKTASAVCLKHLPTGIVIKCHQSRSLVENRKTARTLLLNKLDNLLNGEHSVENQKKSIEAKKHLERIRRRNKLREIKEEWKKHQQDNQEL